MATNSKSKSGEVETVVKTADDTETAVETIVEAPVAVEAQVEQEVEQAEVPVPADFKGKELLIDGFASEVSVLAGYVGGMEQALLMVIGKNAGNALLVSQGKDGTKERVLLVPENILFIQAALASRPSLRPMFKATVVSLIEKGRQSAEYQAALADLAAIEENRANVQQALRAMTEEYAQPFDAELFVSMWSLDKVIEATPTAAAQPGRARSASSGSARKGKWSLPEYERVERSGTYYLRQGAWDAEDENGIVRSYPWGIFDEFGALLAAGRSGADADKNWLLSRGMSTSVNSVLRWGVVAAEEAAAA